MADYEIKKLRPVVTYVAQIEAYAFGIEAGRVNEDCDNPYPEGCLEAKSFEHGYLDGQKIRSDDRPPVGV